MLALVEARFGEGTHETYQVPIGLRPADEGWDERVICETADWTVLRRARRSRRGARAAAPHAVGVGRDRGGRDAALLLGGGGGRRARRDVDVRPVGVEQSNSSIVFGDDLILKVFRRVEPGVNPELELLRFLTSAGFPNIAALAGTRTITIHAPRVKLVNPTTNATNPVVVTPTRLMASPACQPGSFRRSQRTTMPPWERVKAVKTPTA